ncbi:DJ-1/PfpI family protein [Halobacterium zhouii]|uniref:DJ-1/PfpI family protein n=1 Tax=Halobacterium zhouii TaxID=2902624 RepID=UPI001E5FFE05|nr:DJ-1/PfpI family protein [Halobacterium zhouii]
MDVAILLYEGFDELDAIGPYEVLRTAADFGGDVDTALRTLVPSESVTASHGLRVEPDDVLLGTPDLVLVPGGGWNDESDAGAWAEVQDGTLPERLATLHDAGARIATVCTGALIAAEGGLLNGRPATTHHTARDDLADYGADVLEDRVVDDGDVLTAGGVTAGIDLALHVVEAECGSEIADQVAEEIEYEQN